MVCCLALVCFEVVIWAPVRQCRIRANLLPNLGHITKHLLLVFMEQSIVAGNHGELAKFAVAASSGHLVLVLEAAKTA